MSPVYPPPRDLLKDKPMVVTAADHAAFAFHADPDRRGRGQCERIDVIDILRFDGDGRIVGMRAFFGPYNIHAA